MTAASSTEGLLRSLAPQALGAVVRRYGDFADAEDAVQEALLAASIAWATGGEPDNPLAWVIRVASRRLPSSTAATIPGDAGRTSQPRGRASAPTRLRGATTR